MRRFLRLAAFLATLATAAPAFAQYPGAETVFKPVVPLPTVVPPTPTVTPQQYNEAIRELVRQQIRSLSFPTLSSVPAYTLPRYRSYVPMYPTFIRDAVAMNLLNQPGWTARFRPDGWISAFDGDMHPWRYDWGVRSRMKFLTAGMCFGEGLYRTCY